MKNFKILMREITTQYGKEIVIEKRYNLFKDRWQDRLWVVGPNDPILDKLKGVCA